MDYVVFVRPITFDQADPRWARNIYSNHNDRHQTMATSGSGPTIAADVVATLKDDISVTPWTMAQLALEWKCRTYFSGTSHQFFGCIARFFNFSKYVKTRDFNKLIECLDAGGLVVVSMGPGYWWHGTTNYLLAWKYDEQSVHCVTATDARARKQDIDGFKRDARAYFCFYPDDNRYIKLNRSDE